MLPLKKFLFGALLVVTAVVCSFSPVDLARVFTTWNDVHALQNAFGSDNAFNTTTARRVVRDVRAWRASFSEAIAFAPALAWLPQYGGDMAQAPALAAYLDQTLDAVEPSLQVYDALDANLAHGDSYGAALIALAQEYAPQISAARKAVTQVKPARTKIQERDLSPQTHALLASADRALSEWDAALQLLDAAPALLGNDAPRHYLMLAQNNDELRATGGFISAVGVLRVERGNISVEWFGDSFAADDLARVHPPPPLPLQRYMWASQWLVRDSNWYADFPTSARVAQDLYANDHRLKTDGVIAVDTRFLPRLVAALPNLTLEGQPLAQSNVIALLKASWQPMPPGDMSAAWFNNDRKNFLAAMMSGMLTALREGNAQTGALAQALYRGLREKSVQLYLNDEPAEQAILDANWGGAVEPGADDYLLVVDSNVGFNKVNARVSREIFYNVDLNENRARVEINYQNPSRAADGECDLLKQHKDNSYASMEQSCYWNYVRVLAPRGAQFIAAQGVSDAGIADDVESVAAFGGYAIIPRSTTQSVKFDYAFATPLIRDASYTLNIQQQAGANAAPITVRVKIPDGYTVRGASDVFVWREKDVLEFHETLWSDTPLKIYFNAQRIADGR
jgi:hypothetical protein